MKTSLSKSLLFTGLIATALGSWGGCAEPGAGADDQALMDVTEAQQQALTNLGSYPNIIQRHAEAINADGRVFVFTLMDSTQDVYLKMQTAAGNLGYPRGYTNLGHPAGYSMAKTLVAGMNRGGQIWVFATTTSGTNRIWYRKQTTPGGSTFSAWTNLGQVAGGWGQTALANFADGTLGLFYQDSSYRIGLCNITPGGFVNYPALASRVVANKFTVAKNSDGRLEIFTAGTSNAIYHLWQTGDYPQNWSSQFTQLGVNTPSPVDGTADIAWTLNQSNGLEIFVNTTDRRVLNCWQDGSVAGGWYNGWGDVLPGYNSVYKRMVVGKRSDGGLDLVWATSSTTGYHVAGYAYQLPGSVAWVRPADQSFPRRSGRGTFMIYGPTIETANISMFTLPSGVLGAFSPMTMASGGFIQNEMDYAYELDHDGASNPVGWSETYYLNGDY